MTTQDFSTISKHLSFPINRAGWPHIAVAVVVTFILGHIWSVLGWLGFFATLGTIWFFRDPKRVTPTRDGLVVGAADGKVWTVDTAVPPAELGLGSAPLPRVTVLRGLAAVQVNRVPVDATVAKTARIDGAFHLSTQPEAETENTRVGVVFNRADGTVVAMVQYAGALARRVECELAEGQSVRAGEGFGLPRFTIEPLKPLADKLYRRFVKKEAVEICSGPVCGLKGCNVKLCDLKACFRGDGRLPSCAGDGHLASRVDIYLPAGGVALVAPGQSVVAGETVLADLASTEAPRPFETR